MQVISGVFSKKVVPMKSQIKGIGHALPDRIMTNEELETMVDTSTEWIIERTGILERRIAGVDTAASDLSYEAALMALERSGMQAKDLDLIIVGTSTPDMLFPSTACIVQDRLGARNVPAFDLEAGCTGFVYSLVVAEKFLLSPEYNNILVVGVDICSRIIDYSDRNTCVLFGDGAGAAILGKGSGDTGILGTYLGADGSGGQFLCMPGGGSARPASHESVEQGLHCIKMDGSEIFRFATRITVDISEKLLGAAGYKYEDVDLFVPHQSNMRIIKSAMRRMKIPEEKTVTSVKQFGNMSAACLPVALSIYEEEGKLQEGDLVLLAAFGAGLSYGGALLRWGRDKDVF